jgi:thiosulfate reductase / polysulfide reductase chain A
MSEAIEVKKSICSGCKAECGVLAYVQDNHLVKAVEDPDYPRKVWPPTRACVRLRAAKEWFYHPQRLNYPLKRKGARGEGNWERISWDQAFDEMADKLKDIIKKYGPEGLFLTEGTAPREEHPIRDRFFSFLGNPLNSSGAASVCFWPRTGVAMAIVGMYSNMSVRPSTKCIVALGVEPMVSRPVTAYNIRKAINNGAKYIVIDPRRTDSARMADIHLQVRPGSDCALMMGMINVIINEGLYDKQFVDKWCYGFDKLKERIKDYTPESAEKICDVPAEKIKEAARMYASNRPGAMVEGLGQEHQSNNAEIMHCRWILAALVNNIDIEGGEELTGPYPQILGYGQLEPRENLSEEQKKKQLGSDRFRLLSWPGQRIQRQNLLKVWPKLPAVASIGHGPSTMRAILTGKPYPVRAGITAASNPMITSPNIKTIYEALKSLDFYAVTDHVMTPSAELADYVLPAASWMERPMLFDQGETTNYVISGEAALPLTIPGEYDHRTDFDFWRGLAIRMGQEKYWPWRNLEEFYDARLKPTGMTHHEFVYKVRAQLKPNPFRKYEKTGFATGTGKIELYSTTFERLGYDPLPVFREHGETKVSRPDMLKRYPLTLITGGRVRQFYCSEFRHVESVRKLHPDPLIQIHPETAAKLAIKEGDWVWIESPRGKVKMKATLFDGVKPDVVSAEYGWWLPEKLGPDHGVWDVNINVLLADDPDLCNQITGAFPLRTALCRVYKEEAVKPKG